MNDLAAQRSRDYEALIHEADGAHTREEIAAMLGMSRFALRRLIERRTRMRWSPARQCELCGEPIPWEATERRRFCPGSKCRAKAWRLGQPSS